MTDHLVPTEKQIIDTYLAGKLFHVQAYPYNAQGDMVEDNAQDIIYWEITGLYVDGNLEMYVDLMRTGLEFVYARAAY